VIDVAFLSPINVEKDGIGLPAREMVAHLGGRCKLTHFPLDHAVHGRRHFRAMAEEINRCDVLHVEHAHGFFKVPLYPFREAFLDLLRRVRIPRLVVYHEPVERIPVYFPPGENTPGSLARRVLQYAAVRAARPFADAFWVPWYNRQIFSIPEKVVVHTDYRAAMVRRFAPDARVAVIPAPVFAPRPLEGGRRFPLPFGGGDTVLTVFGFIDRRKDYQGVLEALAALPRRYKLVVAGGCFDDRERQTPGSPYRRLVEGIRARNLEDRVHITGFCPDWAIPEVMGLSAAVLAPFLDNHSSGSINMGLSYSRPVIAYRTLLTEEMNRRGAGLILVGGWRDMVSAVQDLERNAGMAEEALRRGAEYRLRYGFPAQAERFVRWYQDLLAG